MNSLRTAAASRSLLAAMVTRPVCLASVMIARRPTTAVVAPRRLGPGLGLVVRTKTTKSALHLQMNAKKKADAIAEREREMERKMEEAKVLGERLYLWNHIQANHVLWSTTRELRANKSLRQVQFTGKKNTLIKIRKDYWRPMATIQFPEGGGGGGPWDDGGEEAKRLLNLTKKERGRELNDQKGNTVADMAFVLGGGGKGNKVARNFEEIREWREKISDDMKKRKELEKELEELEENKMKLEDTQREVQRKVKDVTEGDGQLEGEGEGGGEDMEVKETKKIAKVKKQIEEVKKQIQELQPLEEPVPVLHKVRVFWANELDHHFAESWPDNVEHVLGLPEDDWTNEDLEKMIANQERLVDLHAVLAEKKLAKREEKAKLKEQRAAKKAKKMQPFLPTPEGETGWKSRPRAPKPFTGKAPKWAKEGL
ncbi:uncharacterized protein PODANS_7_8595 [Podospora anserina S mat+]|uniref:Large ribosomal subunit protein mL67 n=1 Tax=Podospora anserina (strain S / ATCC MYA-4624 / DSM 980 / FGSC 10383) TaxID=515849 RepID=B2AWX3_PODAN|nr:uncharacterized protein PODANS_7_8595 [Podospora anserina S mat+]CAP68897.1 unnamed protein product [Podospora anserina S mat+]